MTIPLGCRLNIRGELRLRRGVWRQDIQREIADCAQARGGGENGRDGVDGDGGGGDVSMRASGNRERQIRFAAQFDCVGGLLRADVHLKLHENFVFALPYAAPDLMDAGDLTWSN